jgi:hypothetical protein
LELQRLINQSKSILRIAGQRIFTCTMLARVVSLAASIVPNG